MHLQFFYAFLILDCSYRISKSGQTRHWITVGGNYFDMGNPDSHKCNVDGSVNPDAAEIARYSNKYADMCFRLYTKTFTAAMQSMVQPMIDLKITEEEFLVLAALNFWSPGAFPNYGLFRYGSIKRFN